MRIRVVNGCGFYRDLDLSLKYTYFKLVGF